MENIRLHKLPGGIHITFMVTAICTFLAMAPFAVAQQDHANHDHPAAQNPGPHGGQVAKLNSQFVETVYLPHQVRVYVFDDKGKPASGQSASGSVQFAQEGMKPVDVALAIAQVPTGFQDYLAAAIDLSKVTDDAVKASIAIEGLPSQTERSAKFQQMVHRTSFKPQLVMAELAADDNDKIAKQGTCPVMGTKLGEHGKPIKVIVDSQPLFLCCKACLPKLQKDALSYMTKAGVEHDLSFANAISTQPATDADAQAIKSQGTCPVTGETLGAHGKVLKVSMGDRSVFICCAACLKAIQKEPSKFFVSEAKHNH